MNHLLKLSDEELLKSQDVINAYNYLCNGHFTYHIPTPIERVAFQMRKETLEHNWKRSLFDVLEYVNLHILKTIKMSEDEATPKMWIVAAVEAWQGTKGTQ